MKNIKCPHCGLVNFADAGECKRCKKIFGETAPSAPPQPEPVTQNFVLPDRRDEKKPWWHVRPIIPLGIFGTLLFFGAKDKFSGTAKPGGYVEALDNWFLIIGGVGYLATFIYLVLRER